MATQQKQFDKKSFQESVKKHLSVTYAHTIENAESRAWYLAMGHALAEFTTLDLLATERRHLLTTDNRAFQFRVATRF